MNLKLGTFGLEALGARRADARCLTSLARDAARYYLDDRDSGRPGWRYPRFRRHAETVTGETCELALAPDDPVRTALAREAERQGVVSEHLLQHALLYHLADLHAGRIA